MAYQIDFITYGGFEYVKKAWEFVALTMNSSAYSMLVTAIFAVSLVFAALMGSLRGLLRAGYAYSWIFAGMIAILMYAAFFQTDFGNWKLDGKLAIYDEITGHNQVISDLPPGIVALAGTFNRIETGLSDLVFNTMLGSITLDHPKQGPLILDFFRKAKSGEVTAILMAAIPAQVHKSLMAYYNDIAAPEFGHSTKLYSEFLRNSSDLANQLKTAANPALYTTTWISQGGGLLDQGETVNGKEAWNRIETYFNKYNWDGLLSKLCAKLGFEIAGTFTGSSCESLLRKGTEEFLGLHNLQPKDLVKNLYLGAMWKRWLSMQDSTILQADVAQTLKTQTTLISSGIASATWLPHLRNILTTVVIAFTPFILLFVASTVYMPAIKTLFGLYTWLAVWGVMDAVVTSTWIYHAKRVWDVVSNVGYANQELFWTLASKSLAVLGGMQWMGLTFAGVITYSILGFGGAALAQLARGVIGRVEQGAAMASASVMLDPGKSGLAQLAHSSVDTAKLAGMAGVSPDFWFKVGHAQTTKANIETYKYGSIDSSLAPLIGNVGMRELWMKYFSTPEMRDIPDIGKAMLYQKQLKALTYENMVQRLSNFVKKDNNLLSEVASALNLPKESLMNMDSKELFNLLMQNEKGLAKVMASLKGDKEMSELHGWLEAYQTLKKNDPSFKNMSFQDFVYYGLLGMHIGGSLENAEAYRALLSDPNKSDPKRLAWAAQQAIKFEQAHQLLERIQKRQGLKSFHDASQEVARIEALQQAFHVLQTSDLANVLKEEGYFRTTFLRTLNETSKFIMRQAMMNAIENGGTLSEKDQKLIQQLLQLYQGLGFSEDKALAQLTHFAKLEYSVNNDTIESLQNWLNASGKDVPLQVGQRVAIEGSLQKDENGKFQIYASDVSIRNRALADTRQHVQTGDSFVVESPTLVALSETPFDGKPGQVLFQGVIQGNTMKGVFFEVDKNGNQTGKVWGGEIILAGDKAGNNGAKAFIQASKNPESLSLTVNKVRGKYLLDQTGYSGGVTHEPFTVLQRLNEAIHHYKNDEDAKGDAIMKEIIFQNNDDYIGNISAAAKNYADSFKGLVNIQFSKDLLMSLEGSFGGRGKVKGFLSGAGFKVDRQTDFRNAYDLVQATAFSLLHAAGTGKITYEQAAQYFEKLTDWITQTSVKYGQKYFDKRDGEISPSFIKQTFETVPGAEKAVEKAKEVGKKVTEHPVVENAIEGMSKTQILP